MPWEAPERWDRRTFDACRALIGVRRASRALREGGLRWAVVEPDAVVFVREVRDERVLVAVSRAPWDGAVLPAQLAPTGTAEVLHGPALGVRPDGLHVPGDGPAVGIWRLA
jgi:alpha-glucosidase